MIEKRGNSLSRSASLKLIPPREKFNITKMINEKCQDPEFAPDERGKCKTGQSEICIQEPNGKNWKMVTCKLDGFINPQTGKCDCDPNRTKKLLPKKHKRTTRTLRRSHRKPNRFWKNSCEFLIAAF